MSTPHGRQPGSNPGGVALVMGATGQQGGAVAAALRKDGWKVRALVREPAGAKARALADEGVEVVAGNYSVTGSVRAAMQGADCVYSVQPSSGQGALYNVSDEDEVRWGCLVGDLAVETGVRHLIYASSNSAGGAPTGVGHFDSKTSIERHVLSLPLQTTVLRPSTFMELLLMPAFGLSQGRLRFLMRPRQQMQFIAVQDIGRIAAAVAADPRRYSGQVLEIAGDGVSGDELARGFSEAAGRKITYERFPDADLAANALFARLAKLVDDGPLRGQADIHALQSDFPGLLTFDAWLASAGALAFREALA